MLEIIFATTNPAKLAQMAYVIEATRAPVTLVAAWDRYGDLAAYDEYGPTAASIAQHGALEIAKRVGAPVLTEDTSFHVETLNGEPGIHAGQFLKDQGRPGILRKLKGNLHRTARIVSAACWATPYGESQTWVTVIRGVVSQQEAWADDQPEWVAPSPDDPLGGGYNAIFIPIYEKRTLAQIPPRDALLIGYREPNFSAALAFVQSNAAMRVRP